MDARTIPYDTTVSGLASGGCVEVVFFMDGVRASGWVTGDPVVLKGLTKGDDHAKPAEIRIVSTQQAKRVDTIYYKYVT